MQNKSNLELEDMMEDIKKKFMSTKKGQDFSVWRNRIENMIDEGYRVHLPTEEDRDHLKNMRLALSNLEVSYFSTQREDGSYPEKPDYLRDDDEEQAEPNNRSIADTKAEKKLAVMKQLLKKIKNED